MQNPGSECLWPSSASLFRTTRVSAWGRGVLRNAVWSLTSFNPVLSQPQTSPSSECLQAQFYLPLQSNLGPIHRVVVGSEMRFGHLIFKLSQPRTSLSSECLQAILPPSSPIQEWLAGLDQLSILLGTTHNRERFIAVCLMPTPFSCMVEKFRKNLPRTIHWRWDSALLFLRELLPLGAVIKEVFRKETWLRGAARDVGAESEEVAGHGHRSSNSLNVELLHLHCTSPFFWSYSHLIMSLNEVVKRFGSWCEGCTCHSFWHLEESTVSETLKRWEQESDSFTLLSGQKRHCWV